MASGSSSTGCQHIFPRTRTDWIPNRHGGRENLEAIEFLREVNEVTHKQVPDPLIMAEESTSWPLVTKPTYLGGLGFDLKWNMGWNTHPGKKLMFMGNELAQGDEWNSTRVLDWYVLDYAFHQGVNKLVRSINRLYRDQVALHSLDFDGEGFEWIDCHDARNSVLIFQRKGQNAGEHLVVALNFTPIPRDNYRISVPDAGPYGELFNSDSEEYGGSGVVHGAEAIPTEPVHWMNHPNSLVLTLPPLAGIVLKPLASSIGGDDALEPD